MKLYYYIFYRILSLWRKIGKNDVVFSAMIAFTLFFWINIVTISSYFEIKNKYTYEDLKYIILVLILGMVFINYLLLVRNDRYKIKIERYSNETKHQQILGNVITTLCIIATYVWFFVKIVF